MSTILELLSILWSNIAVLHLMVATVHYNMSSFFVILPYAIKEITLLSKPHIPR